MKNKSNRVEPQYIKIGDWVIGGYLGEYPTAIILSLFHHGDRIVQDHKTGRFDKTRARRYLNRALKLQQATGNPFILDILAETPEAMEKYLSFAHETVTETPFLIDSSSKEARLAGIKYVASSGKPELTIYDSIGLHTSSEELKALQDAKIKAAILLAHNPTDIRPQGRLEALKGPSPEEGLIAKAQQADITKILVDTVALDLAGLSIAAAAMTIVKNKFGYPVGAGSANSVALWRRASKISPAAKRYLAPALCTYLQCKGADFILAGPVRHAPRFYSAVAVTDALLAYITPNGDYPAPAPKTRKHPRYTIL